MRKPCAVCGNEYDKPIEITYEGKSLDFDCFECAIHALAPECEHCGIRIIGHGMQAEEKMYCCAHCARADGEVGLADRASSKGPTQPYAPL